MNHDLIILTITAASIGFFHTLFGPDHYLPFIMIGKARKWSIKKTAWITAFCGIGHVLGSVIFGIIGIALGIAVKKLEFIESFRGNLAAWVLVSFGFAYAVWGIRQIIRNKPHTHQHIHSDQSTHSHKHTHQAEHIHIHNNNGKAVTPWILFVIFVLGPCEPLIPILMYPAAEMGFMEIVLVAGSFALVTILTMLTVVVISLSGIEKIPTGKLEKYSHVIAGTTILMSGIAIRFLGL